jgi:hypothetical protein
MALSQDTHGIFSAQDKNHDGFLSGAELVSLLDRNGDSKIGLEELKEFLKIDAVLDSNTGILLLVAVVLLIGWIILRSSQNRANAEAYRKSMAELPAQQSQAALYFNLISGGEATFTKAKLMLRVNKAFNVIGDVDKVAETAEHEQLKNFIVYLYSGYSGKPVPPGESNSARASARDFLVLAVGKMDENGDGAVSTQEWSDYFVRMPKAPSKAPVHFHVGLVCILVAQIFQKNGVLRTFLANFIPN